MAEKKAVKKTPEQPKLKDNNTQLAGLAHFSFLAILILGPFSMAIPLIIWLLERNKEDKSTYVEFQAKQAFFFQLAVYLATAVLGIVVGVLSIILIGLLFIPFLILVPIAGVVYGVYAGIQVWNGKDFRYMYVADFIDA